MSNSDSTTTSISWQKWRTVGMGGENVPDCSYLLFSFFPILAIENTAVVLSCSLHILQPFCWLEWVCHSALISHWQAVIPHSLQIVYLSISMFNATLIEPLDLICMLYLYKAASCRTYKECPFKSFFLRLSWHSNHYCRVDVVLAVCHITGSWLWLWKCLRSPPIKINIQHSTLSIPLGPCYLLNSIACWQNHKNISDRITASAQSRPITSRVNI